MPIFICYDAPTEKARTGHVALIVTDDPNGKFNSENIICFYSLYHALNPSDVRSKIATKQILHGMDSYALTSDSADAFKQDQIMRGQSWYVMGLGKDKNCALQDLVRIISLFSDAKKQDFFDAHDAQKDNHQIALPEAIKTLLKLNSNQVSILDAVSAALKLKADEMESFLNDEQYRFSLELPDAFKKLFREDVPVPVLIKEMESLPQEKKDAFYEAGKYHYLVRLPDSFSDRLAIEEVKRLREQAKWAMYSAFSNFAIPGERHAYNCCSAIRSVLAKSDTRRNEYTDMFKTFMWAAYVVFMGQQLRCSSDQCSDSMSLLYWLPMLHVLNNARLYANDMTMMATKKTPFFVVPMVYALSVTVNMLGLLFGSAHAAREAFSFPSALFREVRDLPGSIVYEKDVKGNYKVQPKPMVTTLGLA